MGDMADYYMDHVWYEDIHSYEGVESPGLVISKMLRAHEEGNLKWKPKKGVRVLVAKMGDDHLINTINMLKRNLQKTTITRLWIVLLELEAYKRKIIQ